MNANNNVVTINGVRYAIGPDGHSLTPLEDSVTPKTRPHPISRAPSNSYDALQSQAQRLLDEYERDLKKANGKQRKQQLVNVSRKQGCIIGFLWAFTSSLFGAMLAPRRRRSYRR